MTADLPSEWPQVCTASGDDDIPVGCVYGWNYDDPLKPCNDLYGIKRLPLGTYYTNREIADLVHPNKQHVPFIYDDFGELGRE